MAAVMSGAMEFGFVPSETVSALHDLGNWKVRADAIERLSACVSDLAPGGRAALPRINEFVAFLNKLLGDPNFKISLTTLQIWETLLQKLGKQARPAVEVVVPTLVKKLGDSKSVVKEANMRALNSLYRVLPEDTVHAIFSVYDGGGKFSRERSIPREGPALARLKEDAICALMRAMLNADRFPHPDVSNAEIVSRLVAAASANEQGKGFDDSKTDLKRARATAVEAIALVHASLGKDETWRLVDNAKNGQGRKECGANLRWQLTTRFEDARVARLSCEGLIEHCAAAIPPLAAGVKEPIADGGTAKGVKGSSSGSAGSARTAEARVGSSLNLTRRRPAALSLNASLDLEPGPPSSSSQRGRLLSKSFGLNSPRGVADGATTRAASTPSPDHWDEFSSGESSGGSNGALNGPSSRASSRNGGESALGRRAAAAREKAAAAGEKAAGGGVGISGPRATFKTGVAARTGLPGTDGGGRGAKKPGPESEPERPSWLDDVHAAAAPVRSKSPPIAGRRAIAAPNSPDSPGKSSALTGQKLTALKRRQDLNRRSLSRTSSASALDASDAESDDLAHAGTQPTTRTAGGRRAGQVGAPGPSHSLSRSVPSGAGVGVGVGGGVGGGVSKSGTFSSMMNRSRSREPSPARGSLAAPRGPGGGGDVGSKDFESGSKGGTFAPGGRKTPTEFGRRGALRQSANGGVDAAGPGVKVGVVDRGSPRKPVGTSGIRSGASTPTRIRSGASTPTRSRGVADAGARPLEDGDVETADLQPLSAPDAALRKAMAALATASKAKPKDLDWQAQYEALGNMRRAVVHHSPLVVPAMHNFVLAIIPAIESLRSATCTLAMKLVREVGQFIDSRALEPELDYLLPTLAKKSGENTWLGDTAEEIIEDFTRKLTDVRVLAALLPSTKHKNSVVRQKTTWHIEYVLSNATASTFKGTAANRDLLEKTFVTLIPLCEEGEVNLRALAKRSMCHLHRMLDSADFDRLLKGLQNEMKAKKVRSVVEKGPPPLPTSSGGTSRNGFGTFTPRGRSLNATPDRTRPNSRSERVDGDLLSQRKFGRRAGGAAADRQKDAHALDSGRVSPAPLPLAEPVARKPIARGGGGGGGDDGSAKMMDALRARASIKSSPQRGPGGSRNGSPPGGDGGNGGKLLEALAPAFVKLKSKDWTERLDGLRKLEAVAKRANSASFTERATTQMFDVMTPTIGDSNSKVSSQALETLADILPSIRDGMAPALKTLVPKLAAGIGSTNEKVRGAAEEACESLVDSVSPELLAQPFAHCVTYGVARAKPALLHRLADVVEAVHPTKPQLISKHVLPAAMSTLMNEKNLEIKAANASLVATIARLLGKEALLQHAQAISPAAERKMEQCLSGK